MSPEPVQHADTVRMESESLTAEEVKVLPDGTEVVITWSGGNGPHRYVIEQANGSTYAQPPADPHGPLRWYNPISFVGREQFHTRVWRAQSDGRITGSTDES